MHVLLDKMKIIPDNPDLPTKNTLRSPVQSQWGKCKRDQEQKDYIDLKNLRSQLRKTM